MPFIASLVQIDEQVCKWELDTNRYHNHLIISFVVSVYLSVRVQQFGHYATDFHEI